MYVQQHQTKKTEQNKWKQKNIRSTLPILESTSSLVRTSSSSSAQKQQVACKGSLKTLHCCPKKINRNTPQLLSHLECLFYCLFFVSPLLLLLLLLLLIFFVSLVGLLIAIPFAASLVTFTPLFSLVVLPLSLQLLLQVSQFGLKLRFLGKFLCLVII